MRQWGPWRIATVLVALLAFGSVVLVFGREDEDGFPSVTNTRPSGLGAFAELLRQDGYVVVLDRDERPVLRAGDLAIGVQIGEPQRPAVRPGRVTGDPANGQAPDPVWGSLTTFANDGGRVLTLVMPQAFRRSSAEATESVVAFPTPDGRSGEMTVTSDRGFPVTPVLGSGRTAYQIGPRGGPALVDVDRMEGGMAVTVQNGLAFSNRFVGRGQNAEYALAIVRKTAPAGSRVVFTEATFGNVSRKGILGTLGPWAVALQWQLVLLTVVIIVSLGHRFGEPERESESQRGVRELVDALGETLRRGRKHDYALESLCQDTLTRARKLLRLAPTTAESEVTALLPPEFQDALRRARALAAAGGTLSTCLSAARALEAQRRAFETDHRVRRPSAPPAQNGGRR